MVGKSVSATYDTGNVRIAALGHQEGCMKHDHLCSNCVARSQDSSPERELSEGGRCPMCNVQISYGTRNRKKISVNGTNHHQVLQVTQDLSRQHESKPLHTLITHWSFWFGTLLVISGFVITILGYTGDAEISLFGQTIKSTSVGITLGFIGALSVSRNIRNVLHHDSKKSA